MTTVPLYDAFAVDYDRFVAWQGRLTYEMPFIERALRAVSARRVLDVACGTGRHAIALAQRGYDAVGADVSARMIERARTNAAADKADVRFIVAGFGELAEQAGRGFDALLCLGNSLPHILTSAALRDTLRDFAAVLRPGGLLIIQNRNFDAVVRDRNRWMSPQAARADNHEWLFVRFYDFNADGTITFNVIMLRRADDGEWTQQVEATTLRPLLHDELRDAVAASGFSDVTRYGDMTGVPFAAATSGNLIVTARRD